MRLLKNNLSILHPDGIFLSSQSNEEQTEGDILEMGQKLAEEVKNSEPGKEEEKKIIYKVQNLGTLHELLEKAEKYDEPVVFTDEKTINGKLQNLMIKKRKIQ